MLQARKGLALTRRGRIRNSVRRGNNSILGRESGATCSVVVHDGVVGATELLCSYVAELPYNPSDPPAPILVQSKLGIAQLSATPHTIIRMQGMEDQGDGR